MRIRSLVQILVIALLLLVVGLGSSSLVTTPASAAQPEGSVPFHPPNPNYWNVKAALNANAPSSGGGLSPAPLFPPTTFVGAAGLPQSGYTPGDSNGAIGTDRYIETINETVAVYDRNLVFQSKNTLSTWSGGQCGTGDPVIMYSAPDQRFYATCITNGNLLTWGFSKSSQPTANSSDWCFYSSNFGGRYGGSNLPDYPKLGDTSDFVLMGVNTFTSFVFAGADVAWAQKPAKGVITTCPDISQFKLGVVTDIRNKDGSQPNAPNPMKQADANNTGVVLVAADVSGGGSATFITAFKVTNSGGSAVLSAPAQVNVASFSMPPDAPQKGTNVKVSTLDGRLMSGWMWKDPSGKWHAVSGHTVTASGSGLGAEFRWYVVTPGKPVAKGIVNDPNLYVFMGAVSPDRNGAAAKFGTNLLSVINTSSSNAYISVSMSSFLGATKQQSSIVAVYNSTVPYTGCINTCRWGDYSGASPDPASTAAGQVWGTAMESQGTTWGTWNFGATP